MPLRERSSHGGEGGGHAPEQNMIAARRVDAVSQERESSLLY